ncbi:hypothetical protein ATN79_33195 [Paraburkholderia caribensis]|nr:hypothetical protein ATN79_33195 [Paraburkholderia caribensis]
MCSAARFERSARLFLSAPARIHHPNRPDDETVTRTVSPYDTFTSSIPSDLALRQGNFSAALHNRNTFLILVEKA